MLEVFFIGLIDVVIFEVFEKICICGILSYIFWFKVKILKKRADFIVICIFEEVTFIFDCIFEIREKGRIFGDGTEIDFFFLTKKFNINLIGCFFEMFMVDC